MRKIFRARNALLLLVALPTVLFVSFAARFTYRLNNICGPGDHIIKSEDDALKQAKIRIFSARYGSHGRAGYVDEKPRLVNFNLDCCEVTRSRTAFGVILWKIYLHGETIEEPKKRYVSAQLLLSNCGAVFVDDSFITADPTR